MLCANSDFCSFFKNRANSRSKKALALKARYCRGEHSYCSLYYVMYWLSNGYILPDDFCMDEVGGHLMDMTPIDHSRARSLIDMMYMPESPDLPVFRIRNAGGNVRKLSLERVLS